MSDFRLKRVESLIQHAVSEMIVMGVIKDHRVSSFISVTGVEVSKDTAYAKVYVSSFENPQAVDSAVKALNHAAGFIQGKLGKKLSLRNTPRLTFIQDESIERGVRMIRRLDNLENS
jgi:ribosome-binding factor A